MNNLLVNLSLVVFVCCDISNLRQFFSRTRSFGSPEIPLKTNMAVSPMVQGEQWGKRLWLALRLNVYPTDLSQSSALWCKQANQSVASASSSQGSDNYTAVFHWNSYNLFIFAEFDTVLLLLWSHEPVLLSCSAPLKEWLPLKKHLAQLIASLPQTFWSFSRVSFADLWSVTQNCLLRLTFSSMVKLQMCLYFWF